jgi:hypothetical protein
MPTLGGNTSFNQYGSNNPTGIYTGTDIRYFKPQPGTVEVDASSPTLTVMDVGNWKDVLDYLGINPEE